MNDGASLGCNLSLSAEDARRMTRTRYAGILLCWALSIFSVFGATADAASSEGSLLRFTVRDSVEMAYFGLSFVSDPSWLDDDGVESPDGRYLVKVTHRGVLPEGVTEGSIWIFDPGAIRSGIAHPKGVIPEPKLLVRLSATTNGMSFMAERENTISRVSWNPDSRSLTFLARDGRDNRQVFKVDVDTRKLIALTPADQNAIDYAWSGEVLTYLAGADIHSERDWWSTGADIPDVVEGTGQSLLQLLYPHWRDLFHENATLQVWQVRDGVPIAVTRVGSRLPLSLSAKLVAETLAVSPDGSRMVTIASDGSLEVPTQQQSESRDGLLSSMQYRLIDLSRGIDVALTDASLDDPGNDRYRAAWSPSGTQVVVTNIHRRGDKTQSCTVAIIVLETRHLRCMVLPKGDAHAFLYSLSWGKDEREIRVRFRTPGVNIYHDRQLRLGRLCTGRFI